MKYRVRGTVVFAPPHPPVVADVLVTNARCSGVACEIGRYMLIAGCGQLPGRKAIAAMVTGCWPQEKI